MNHLILKYLKKVQKKMILFYLANFTEQKKRLKLTSNLLNT
jgi:hypothetical protein